jgi:Zn-dependent M28 family amino/carboxypeptidase
VTLLHKLGMRPKRTVRLVFWVNEENGEAGGHAYRKMLGKDLDSHVAAIEMDEGAERPLGMAYGGFGWLLRGAAAPDLNKLPPAQRDSIARLRDIVSLLKPIGADTVSLGGGGSDIEPITNDGVPSLSPRTNDAHYFDWHHTEADTLDKVDPVEFRKNAAMLSVVTYILADMDGRLSGEKATGGQ